MFSQTALISLACLLSTGEGEPSAIAKLTEKLSPTEMEYIDAVQKNGACLPERFKKLIQRRSDAIGDGAAGDPTTTQGRPEKDSGKVPKNPLDAQAGVRPSSDF